MSKFGMAFTCACSGICNQLLTRVGFASFYADNGKPASLSPIPEIKWNALWDTGAQTTVISKKIAEELNLKPCSMIKMVTPSGETTVPQYNVNVYLPNYLIMPVIVAEGKLNGFDALIGMDVMINGDFALSNINGNTVFTFRIPSMHRFDFTQNTYNQPYRAQTKPGRNDPCICGSGKKTKECCGV